MTYLHQTHFLTVKRRIIIYKLGLSLKILKSEVLIILVFSSEVDMITQQEEAQLMFFLSYLGKNNKINK